MRTQRIAFTLGAIALAGSATMPTIAQADATSSTFYVDNATSASCSDSTTDSSTTPYCTIQAAVDAATSPGDTVIVTPSSAYAPFTVTASGTAGAPITIEAPASYQSATRADVTATAADDVPAVTLNGVSYVSIERLAFQEAASQSAVTVQDSSHVTVDSSLAVSTPRNATTPTISIGTGSSQVTVSRNNVSDAGLSAAVSAQGGSDDVITTNKVTGATSGIVLSGTTSSDITGNTVADTCEGAIEATDGSTTASIENNYVPYLDGCSNVAAAADVALLVDSASTADTVANYNTLSSNASSLPDIYSWAGTTYTTSAAFTAATGQGTHDSTQYIDSADSDAPGELSTDLYGDPRVDDPAVSNTGSGTYDYYDRGATETEDPIRLTRAENWPTEAPTGGTGTYAGTVTDAWGNTIESCTYNFGDGSDPVTVTPDADGDCSTQHTYSATGTYDVTLLVTVSTGYALRFGDPTRVVAPSAFEPAFTVVSDGSLSVYINITGSQADWSFASCTFDFGDGTTTTYPGTECAPEHSYPRPGTYTVTATFTDAGGDQDTLSQSFTTPGSFYTPVTPDRILDTRHAIGVATAGAVASDGTVKLEIAGVDGLPATGVTAVALNVTATEGTKIGYLTAYPDGGTLPTTSNVDFKANQNVANTVIVEVGSDGYVDLANESAGTTDILADLQGYYSLDGTSGYTSVTQTRVLDTRQTKTPVAAGGTVRLDLGASYPGITAAVLNVTAVDETGNGYLTAYPEGGSVPATSNVNYLAGQTVPNEVIVQVGSNGYVDFTNSGKGEADIFADLSGYFTADTGEAFTPVAPERYLDTRIGLGLLVGVQGAQEAGPDQTDDLIVGGVCVAAENGVCVGAQEVPGDAAAVAANVTVASPTANGFITVYPGAVTSVPNASVLNFLAGQQPQNAVTVALGAGGRGDFNLYNGSSGDTQLIVDVFGYYGG